MKSSFAGQPFENGQDLRDFLLRVLQDPAVLRVRFAVAWAKRSGLGRIAPHLTAFAARGGSSSIVIGIDEGGATKQGLALALQLFEEVFVLHDEGGGTFHPKIYLAEAEQTAWLLVGSNNLTAGGLYFNYEAGIECEIDLTSTDPSETSLYEGVSEYLDRLLDDDPCIRLDQATLDALVADPRYRIGDEDAVRRKKIDDPDAPEDLDSAPLTPVDADDELVVSKSLFGKSTQKKRAPLPIPADGAASPPRTTGTAPRATTPPPAVVPVPGQAAAAAPSAGGPATVVKRWFKKMTNSDAQQKRSPNTQITGNLKLGKAGLQIDHKTYFRYDFFANQPWQSQNRPRGAMERAMIPFEVFDGAVYLGTKVLNVDHAEFRIADQNNVPTWLHWGDDLNNYLRANNHVDDYVTLEKLSDGSFRIRFDSAAAGPFMP